MKRGTYKARETRRVATGGQGYGPRVSVAFDPRMFARLQALSADRNVSFGEAVRHFVGLGLRTLPSHMEKGE